MLRLVSLVVATVLLMLAAGCGKENQTQTEPGQTAAEITSTVNPAAPSAGNQGRVLATMDVAGYSYIQVESNGRQVWLAGNPVVVQEGDMISWDQSSVMRNFYSKTLDRTFDEILFVSGLQSPASGQGGPLAANHPPVSAPTMPSGQAEPAGQGVVVSTKNAANYTYLEVKMADDSIIWLAAPETVVAANDVVEWYAGSKMVNFVSSSLDRTFPEIYFVAAVNVKN